MLKKILNKKRLLILVVIVLFCFIVLFTYFKFLAPKITLENKLNYEINSKCQIKDLIKTSKNIKITNGNKRINTKKLGKTDITIKYKKRIGKGKKIVTIKIVDTKKPKIEYEKELTTSVGKEIDLLESVKATDNSKEDIKVKVEGKYDFNKEGTYDLKYVAKDSSNNKTKKDFVLKVIKEKVGMKTESNNKNTNKNPYYVEVIRNHNVVVVYGLDENNEYTKIVKVFICSVGLNDGTPTGTFTTSAGQRWHPLFGNVYGQYTTRINGPILFHSVPYYSASPDDLEYDEYNKLGSAASMGCIRMRVVDVKWIYDNCPKGMTVKIYDGDLPANVSKPTFQHIDTESANKGWDPTDPDANNPWKS